MFLSIKNIKILILIMSAVIFFCLYIDNSCEYIIPVAEYQDLATQLLDEKDDNYIRKNEDEIITLDDYYIDDIGFEISDKTNAFKYNVALFNIENVAYLFLPSYYDAQNILMSIDADKISVLFDGQLVEDGDRLSLATDKYIIQIIDNENSDLKFSGVLRVVRLGGVSTIFVESGDDLTTLNESKENIVKGSLFCLNENGKIDSSGKVAINSRGHTSFTDADKKSLKVVFDKKTSILGMNEAKKWVLQSNAFDSTKIRNAICYLLADRLGMEYAVDLRPVNLYMNGKCYGFYFIMEPVDVKNNRLNINNSPENSLIEVKKGKDIEYKGQEYGIKYPKNADINCIAEQYLRIFTMIDECNTQQDYKQLSEYIDMDSFAHMLIMDEITDNADVNMVSTFYYIRDGKLYAGPAWDYDKTFGLKIPKQNIVEFDNHIIGFPEKMLMKKEFRNFFRYKYNDLSDFRKETLDNIDTFYNLCYDACQFDRIIWRYNDGRFYDSGDYTNDVEYLKKRVEDRFDLFTDVINNYDSYSKVIFVDDRGYERIFWKKKGDVFSDAEIDNLLYFFNCEKLLMQNGEEISSCVLYDDYTYVHCE